MAFQVAPSYVAAGSQQGYGNTRDALRAEWENRTKNYTALMGQAAQLRAAGDHDAADTWKIKAMAMIPGGQRGVDRNGQPIIGGPSYGMQGMGWLGSRQRTYYSPEYWDTSEQGTTFSVPAQQQYDRLEAARRMYPDMGNVPGVPGMGLFNKLGQRVIDYRQQQLKDRFGGNPRRAQLPERQRAKLDIPKISSSWRSPMGQ